jgi:hypothetical protein
VTSLGPAADRHLPLALGRPPTVRRRNHGTGHSYTVGGHKTIGVTTALNDGMPKPALVQWAAKTVAEYVAAHRVLIGELGDAELVDLLKDQPRRDRDAAARRGTEVHTLAQTLLAGGDVDVPEELVGHVESYQRFHRDWSPDDVAVEAVVANMTHGWAGTLDYLCELPGIVGLSLLDIKTARSGIFGETALQLAAYASAEVITIDGREWSMPEVDQAFALWVRADGYDLVPVEIGPNVYRHFRCALAVAQRKDALRTYVGEALAPEVVR